MTKQQYRQNVVSAARMAAGLPADDFGMMAAGHAPVAMLALKIREEVAPQIAELHDVRDFIASGKSLVRYLKEKSVPTVQAWARLKAPPLPVGLKMPPNKCFSPAISLPAIAV